MKRISLLLATATLTLAALGGAASADPGPTPNRADWSGEHGQYERARGNVERDVH